MALSLRHHFVSSFLSLSGNAYLYNYDYWPSMVAMSIVLCRVEAFSTKPRQRFGINLSFTFRLTLRQSKAFLRIEEQMLFWEVIQSLLEIQRHLASGNRHYGFFRLTKRIRTPSLALTPKSLTKDSHTVDLGRLATSHE